MLSLDVVAKFASVQNPLSDVLELRPAAAFAVINCDLINKIFFTTYDVYVACIGEILSSCLRLPAR